MAVGNLLNVTVIANASIALDPPATTLLGSGENVPTLLRQDSRFAVTAGRNVSWVLQLLTVGGAAADAAALANYVTVLVSATRTDTLVCAPLG